VAALATLLCATSCSAKPAEPTGPTGSAPPSAPPVSPSTSAEEAEARTKAVEAYDKLRKAQVAASATADVKGGDLAKYAADPLLSEIRNDLYLKQQQGLVTKGKPQWSVKVTDVNVVTRPFTVALEDCFDGTDWRTVFKNTGKSAAVPGQAKKYTVRAEAVQYDDGRWLINTAKADRDRPC
jgi:hypothetical protein